MAGINPGPSRLRRPDCRGNVRGNGNHCLVYCLRQRYNLQRNCSDPTTVAYIIYVAAIEADRSKLSIEYFVVVKGIIASAQPKLTFFFCLIDA